MATTTANLTERQTQIQERVQQGMSAADIAKDLGISTNAVYQQLARMRQRKGGGKRTASRRPAAAAAAPKNDTPTPTTPLQAIRIRRGEIESEVKALEAALNQAQRQVESAQDALAKVNDRHGRELKALARAENVLATDWRERHEGGRKAASANGHQGKRSAKTAA